MEMTWYDLDQKLHKLSGVRPRIIMPGDDFRSNDKRFVRKCLETASPIGDEGSWVHHKKLITPRKLSIKQILWTTVQEMYRNL